MHDRSLFFMVTIISIKYLYQIKVHTFYNIVKSIKKKKKQSHKKNPGRIYRRSDIDRLPQTVVLKKKKVRSTPQSEVDLRIGSINKVFIRRLC